MDRCDLPGSAPSLLGHLGLFIFGGCPLQAQSVHCGRDETRRESKKTVQIIVGGLYYVALLLGDEFLPVTQNKERTS